MAVWVTIQTPDYLVVFIERERTETTWGGTGGLKIQFMLYFFPGGKNPCITWQSSWLCSIFSRDLPYMKELKWNQMRGSKKERAPESFCDWGQPIQTFDGRSPWAAFLHCPSSALCRWTNGRCNPEMSGCEVSHLRAGPLASFSCHGANTFFLPEAATALLAPCLPV